jgi:hypothetical protein
MQLPQLLPWPPSVPSALKVETTRLGPGAPQAGQVRFLPFSPIRHSFSNFFWHLEQQNS